MPHLTDDRTPLMAPFLNSMPPESLANFYSPYDSCHNSDEEDDQASILTFILFCYEEMKLVIFHEEKTAKIVASSIVLDFFDDRII